MLKSQLGKEGVAGNHESSTGTRSRVDESWKEYAKQRLHKFELTFDILCRVRIAILSIFRASVSVQCDGAQLQTS